MKSGQALRALLTVALFASAGACIVPDLTALGSKECDPDAGLGCIDGYGCVRGTCDALGGACSGHDTRPCGSDAGRCRPGTQSCTSGSWGACEGSVGPHAEICDGVDDDCNGLIDDATADAPLCPLQKGVCSGALQRCSGGSYVSTCGKAEYGPNFEVTEATCDGNDNDCDGVTDEDVTGGACGDAGVCRGWNRACVANAPGACLAPDYEATEQTCDGKDNDCDGLVDEGLVSSTPCAPARGVCAGKRAACVDGGFETTCSGASFGPSWERAESRCDGLDNDCDGVSDRFPDGGFIRLGLCEYDAGVCAGAQRVCAGASFEAICSAISYGSRYQPLESACDGLDNDCDGYVDRSRSTKLGYVFDPTTATPSCAATAQGVLCVLVGVDGGSTGVSALVYSGQLKPTAGPLLVSDPSALVAGRPVLATAPGDLIALAWEERLSTGSRVRLARLGPDGSPTWVQTVAAEATVGGPRVAWLAAPDRAVVAWIDPLSLVVHGATYDATGARLAGPIALTSGADAGGEEAASLDLAPGGAGLVVLGWIGQLGQEQRLGFRALGGDLALMQPARVLMVPGETAHDVRVWNTAGGASAAWLATRGSSSSVVRCLPSALAQDSGVLTVSARGALAADLGRAGEGFLAWREDGAVYVAAAVPDAGATLLAPAAAGCRSPWPFTRDGGTTTTVFACAEADGGSVSAVTVCAP